MMTDMLDSPTPDTVPDERKRRILTFMKRSSAFTASQKQGLEQFGAEFLLPMQGSFDAARPFSAALRR